MKVRIIKEMREKGIHQSLNEAITEHRRIGEIGMVAKYNLSLDILETGTIQLPEKLGNLKPVFTHHRISRSTKNVHMNGQPCAPIPDLY